MTSFEILGEISLHKINYIFYNKKSFPELNWKGLFVTH